MDSDTVIDLPRSCRTASAGMENLCVGRHQSDTSKIKFAIRAQKYECQRHLSAHLTAY